MVDVKWPEHPFILEINTWTWLHELSENLGKGSLSIRYLMKCL